MKKITLKFSASELQTFLEVLNEKIQALRFRHREKDFTAECLNQIFFSVITDLHKKIFLKTYKGLMPAKEYKITLSPTEAAVICLAFPMEFNGSHADNVFTRLNTTIHQKFA